MLFCAASRKFYERGCAELQNAITHADTLPIEEDKTTRIRTFSINPKFGVHH